MAHVLVCDDDDEFADMVSRYLKSLGHTTSRAANIVDVATALLQKRPDMMIVDIEMPGGGAIATTRLLKSLGAEDLPVIVCSGLPTEDQVGFFSGLRRVRFFQKPIDLDAFELAVKEGISR